MHPCAPIGYIEFPEHDQVRVFRDPIAIVSTTSVDEVRPLLDYLDAHVAKGFYAAGYLAYEAAPAFDPAFHTHMLDGLPLLYFGIYKKWDSAPLHRPEKMENAQELHWKPAVDQATYQEAFQRIHTHIAAGDTYQVNFTFPTTAFFPLDGLGWFRDRQHAQQAAYSAYINMGQHEVISLSPELFFSLNDSALISCPMKGTRPRGLSSQDDQALANALRSSQKEQAENLMIVDMLRNDMGRICKTNSIHVPALFSIEQYPTVWQMTSTVVGETQASVPEIFHALFPCASVTGAPKIETMKIIRQNEAKPRGVYCGAIGWWGPNREARFNVAIRTAVLDTHSATATYPVGSGITWDAVCDEEYQECKTKATVLQHQRPHFELLTSLRLDADGYFLLSYHLDRLEASAAHFAYHFDRAATESEIRSYQQSVTEHPAKIRVCINKGGEVAINHTTLNAPAPWNVALAENPIDTTQPWVYHKTTHRLCYDQARATRPDCTDVILTTSDDFITEATYANVVLEKDGSRRTPPIAQGLLGGVFRRYLLEQGEIEESPLTVEDLENADVIYLINSVRKWIPVNWQNAPDKKVYGQIPENGCGKPLPCLSLKEPQ